MTASGHFSTNNRVQRCLSIQRSPLHREREREHLFKGETEHLCLRQLIHGIGGGHLTRVCVASRYFESLPL